jgi:hypothetical protein
MLYSELSGPKGMTSLQPSSAAGTHKSPSVKSSSVGDGQQQEKNGGAYSISQSMEELLDRITGKNPGGYGETAGADTPGNADLQRAQNAQRMMQTALEMAKAASKGIDTLKSTLSDALGKLGVPNNRIEDVVSGFGDHLQSKLADVDFSAMALDMQSARSQWSIESRGIELTVNDGDRTLSISFAKSTLDFRKDEQSLQASIGQGGGTLLGVSQSTTQVNAKATGMIVRAEGFSQEEIQGILEKLNGMAGSGNGESGSAGGVVVLTPQKTDKNGIMHLTLDLAAVLDSPSPTANSTVEAPTSSAQKRLDVTA